MEKMSCKLSSDFLDKIGYSMEVFDYFQDLCKPYFDEDLRDEFMAAILMVQNKNFCDTVDYGKKHLKNYLNRISCNYGAKKISPDVDSLAALIKTDSCTPERGFSVLQNSLTNGERQFNTK